MPIFPELQITETQGNIIGVGNTFLKCSMYQSQRENKDKFQDKRLH